MMEILVVLGYVVFCAVLMAGVLATLVGLPGTVLILADALVFSICTHFQRPDWWTLGILLVLSLIGETSDNLLSLWAARHGGGSGRVGWWAMGGGLVGALAGSWAAPLFGFLGVLGVILGVVIVPVGLALAGGYAAAYWYELQQGRSREEAARTGKAALIGRLLGGLAKSLVAVIMVALTLSAVF